MSMASKQVSADEVQELLKLGDFDSFIGLSESTQFEAKPFKPYQLNGDPHGRLELAKDVAGLGNGGGGWLVCGLETNNAQKIDVVSGLRLGADQAYYDEPTIKNALNQFIYPKIDFKISWFPSANDKRQGIGAIYIPPQPTKLYFYLIIPRSIYFPGEKGVFFAIPVRAGAGINWLDKVAIKDLTRNQRSNTDQRLDAMSDALSEMSLKLGKLSTSQSNKKSIISTQIDGNLLDTLADYERSNA